MPNDDVSDEDAYKAFVQTLTAPSNPYPYNDQDNVHPRVQDYAGFINKNTNQPAKSDEQLTHMPQQHMLDADEEFHDQIQQSPDSETQTPLEQLIPRVASGRGTRQDMMRLLAITGKPI